MSALDAFMSTWSAARTTFGQGTLPDGSQFDQSAALREMQSRVASAAPGSQWTGAAADSYADANDKQARTLGNIADLDKRLGVEVDRSAAVVAAGRRDLDAVKQWVSDAAATVPKTEAGHGMLLPIISKGSSQIQDIVTRSNSDLSAIAERIRGLGGEYAQLTGDDRGQHPADKRGPDAPDPADIAHFMSEWNELETRIAEHNAKPAPPANTPAGVAFEYERQQLATEQSLKLAEAAKLGIEIEMSRYPFGK